MEIRKDLGQLSCQIGRARPLQVLEVNLKGLFLERRLKALEFISCLAQIQIAGNLLSTLAKPSAFGTG